MKRQAGWLLEPKTLKYRFDGLDTMKNLLVIYEKSLACKYERYFKAATKHKGEIPTNIEMETVPLTQL